MSACGKSNSGKVVLQQLSLSEQQRRRHFNAREREAIFILSGGICALCSSLLDEHWEPDHVVAFARGGETHIDNAQALCRPCNRRKGDK